MFRDLLQSKNGAPALVLLVLGVLLAIVTPAVMAFPGWAAGFLGLLVGATAGVLAMQGRGANADELLALRTAIKSAQRGERGQRPTAPSRELSEAFEALDLVASDIQARAAKVKDLEDQAKKAKTEVDAFGERLATAEQELTRVVAELSAGLEEQGTAVEQLSTTMQRAGEVLGSVAEDVEQLARNAEQSASSIVELRATGDDVAENMSGLGTSVRDTVSSIEEMADLELCHLEPLPFAATRRRA
jgi:methyl-accepting chemotaxis protein